MAYQAVRRYGMFGEEAGYISIDTKEASSEHNAMIDDQVKKILDVSYINMFINIRNHLRESKPCYIKKK
jgi:hypothetical protein